MSDTKLQPEDLTSEERAIVDNAALFYRRVTGAVGETAEWAYVEALKEAEPIILARRALFAPAPEKVAKVETMADRIAADLKAGTFRGEQPAPPAPEKVAKVECPNCRQPTSSVTEHIFDEMKPGCVRTAYTCKGQQPEPEKVAKVSAFPVGNCVVCGELVAPYNKHAKYEGGYTCQRPQPAPPEPAKVECPNCGEMTEHNHSRYEGPGPDKWACQPAPPELSKVCPNCQKPEEEPHFAGNLTGDGGWYFCPGRVPKAVEDHQRPQSARPVAVGMTEELEHVLSIAERDLRYKEECFDDSARTVPDERIERLRAAIAAVREQAGNGRKVECPNCGEMTSESHADGILFGAVNYTCQPAPPEPAAREMPEAVRDAVDTLRSGVPSYPTWRQYADTLESWWRNLAQPVECKECLKLIDERDRREEQIGRAAAALGMEDEWTSACDVGEALIERCEEISAAANSVLIQQAAQPVASSDAVAELVNVTERTINKLDRTWDQFFAPVRGAITTVRQQAAQPVAVGMTEELRMILDVAESRAEDQRHDGLLECSRNLERAIAAVRQQAAQGRKVELGKVRAYFNTPSALRTVGDERAALAEVDAAEGKGEGRG